jgi:aspartyl/asparaginyl beta-hydroxylase (cupin superfamily)
MNNSNYYLEYNSAYIIFIIICILTILLLYYYHLTILFSLISLFTCSSEFLDKKTLFPNHIYFEDTQNFKYIKNEVLHVLNKTNNGNTILLIGDRNHEILKSIGSDIKIDKFGIKRGWRALHIKISYNYSPYSIYFPTLVRLLDTMPEIKSCSISILEPHVHIPVHTGYHKNIMRYLLPIIVPKNKKGVYLCVNSHKYYWTEGEGVLFDDTYPHSAYNNTNEIRVVIYMDIARPYPGIINNINHFIIDSLSQNKEDQEELHRKEVQLEEYN